MEKYRVALTSRIHEDGIRLLEQEASLVFPQKPINLLTSKDFIDLAKDADALIVVTNVEQIDNRVIENLSKVKIIARHGVGYENVDVKAASERRIYVTVAPVLDESVADNAFALLLCLARNICKAHNYIISKEWKVRDPFRFMGVDVWGKTVGIIGLGRIGSRIAERAKGFKMRILYYDIERKPNLEKGLGAIYRPFDELLKESDFVLVATLLTDETRGMIGEREFSMMKPSAFLVNIARGQIVKHDALVKTLCEGRIAGAGLDVFDQEPLPSDDPLLSLDNVILTSHLSANTVECRRRLAVTTAEEVLRVLHGEPPKYAVNPEIRFHVKTFLGKT